MTTTEHRLLDKAPTPQDLTIALCTIGRDGYLHAALQSLIDTTPAGVSLHVLLNGVDDDSLATSVTEMMSTWDGPFTLTVLEDQLTIAGSHNAALERTTTPFVTFMGDDDIVLEPRVSQILNRFWETIPTPAVIGSFSRRVSGSHDQPRFSTNKDYGPTTVEAWSAHRDSGELIEIVFPSAIYRTELLRSINGFEERFGSAMDLATFTTLGLNHPVLAEPRRSFAHRIHDGSVTSSSARQHASRLRYTEQCMTALRNSDPQPTWDEFLDDEMATSRARRLSDKRQVLSATLFRQGGAAVASGTKAGLSKVAASAVLSPGTFLRRSRSQVASGEAGEPVVAVLLKNLNQYRVPFYEVVREDLRERGVELRLVVADGMAEDHAKGDRATLSWAEHRSFREFSIAGKKLLWQPGFDTASGADLIVTEQASKQLFNIVLAYGQRALHTRLAFWGHGKNFQSSIEGTSGEGLKQRLTRKSHWFFAYNALSAEAAIEAGMPADRITSVMNATDTNHIRRVLDLLADTTNADVRSELGIGSGPVVLTMGGMYPPKRPAYLIEAAYALRELVPDVELLVIGGGSEQHLVAEAAEDHPWIHATGPIYGDERLRLASIADLQIMPGLVGLNVVDAFGLGLPTITTDIDYHSPEIDYLVDGVNGVIVAGDPNPEQFAEATAAVLANRDYLGSLREAADITGHELTIENMARNFANGVVDALNAPPR